MPKNRALVSIFPVIKAESAFITLATMGSLWFGVIWDTFIYDFLTRVIVTLFNRNYDG